MPIAPILLVAVVLISLFCVGLVFLSRNIALSIRLYFCLAILGVIEWVSALYFSNVSSEFTLLFNRVVYIGPILALMSFSLFIDAFYLNTSKTLKRLNIFGIALSVTAMGIAFTSLNVASISPRLEDGVRVGYNIVPGALSIFIAFTLFTLSIGLFARLIVAYRRTDEEKRKPLKLIFRTLVLAITVSLVTNLLGPLLFGGSSLANAISNVTVILFIGTVAYSVLRYSFLDIRLLVVRSIAYVVGLITILGLVTALEVLLFNVLGGGQHELDGQQLSIFVFLLVLATLSFGPLRGLFAQATSRLFFKNSYDSSGFITRFNNNLVNNNIDITRLLVDSSALIEQTLKASFCVMVVRETANTPQYIIGTKEFVLNLEDEKHVIEMTSHGRERVIVRQLLGRETPGGQSLNKLMVKYDVEAIARLIVTTGSKERGIGYIILGPKKSGEIYNKTDVDVLGILANELVLAVQNALRFKEIEKFNITLQQKIDEATRKLRQTNERLRTLDQTKDDFISMASHQLRTPLTSVKGYVSMVLDGDAGRITETQRKLLTQSFLSSQRMVYLISDLLNVSRLKTGKFIIEAVPTDLSKVIEEEVEQLAETVKGRDLELSYHKPEHFPTLMLDETKIRQVIMNFIDNAVYYTPAGGHIDVYLVEKPQSIEFTVVDNGIGVPKREQHHLFTKFYRAHNAKRSRPDGTGLGIFMAKKVVIAQGGAIIFKSAEGKGSTFGFTFAKAKLQPDEAKES